MVNFKANYVNYGVYGNHYPFSPIPRENKHEALKRKYGVGYEDFGMKPVPVSYTTQSIYHTDPLGREQKSWFRRFIDKCCSF